MTQIKRRNGKEFAKKDGQWTRGKSFDTNLHVGGVHA